MNNFKEWFITLKRVVSEETKFILKNPIFIFLLIILPGTFFPFFTFFYSTGIVSDLPVAIYDADNSELSRNLILAIESSRSMKIVEKTTSTVALENGIRSGKFKAAFYFPEGMERDVKKQHQAHPVFYKNSQNIVISSFLYKDATTIFKTYNAGVLLKKIRLAGVDETQAKTIIQPILPDISYLYNPNYNYNNFLSPAYIFVICQMIMMLSGMFCIVHEIEHKKYSRLIPGANRFTIALIMGKSIPVIGIFTIIIAFVLFVLFPFSNVYITGNYFLVFFSIEIYLIASLMLGFAFGAILKDPMVAAEIVIFTNMPSLLLSGYTFPALPKAMIAFAQVLPFSHFMYLFFKTAQMNLSFFDAIKEIGNLLLLACIGLLIAWISMIRLSKFVEEKKVLNESK